MTALIKGLPGNGTYGRYAPCGAITRPMLLHHSVGHDREIRKVEIFADESKGFACDSEQSRDTMLSIEPLPLDEEIAANPEFIVEPLTKRDFEEIWQGRHTR
jgi:hypothetical protein